MNKPIFVNIALCSSGKVYSGGERCLVELIKEFERKGYAQEIIFSHYEEGTEIKESINTKVCYALKNIDYAETKVGALVKYLLTFLCSLKKLKRYKGKVIIISHSEMWPDILYAFLLKIMNPKSKWFAFVHALLPDRKYDSSSFLIRLYNVLNQYIFLLLQRKSNGLITVNSSYLEFLEKYNKNVLIIKMGREYPYKPMNLHEDRVYDMCFMGRYFEYKGIFEIPKIIDSLMVLIESKNIKKRLSFVFMGKENNISSELKSMLSQYSERINFCFKGFVRGEEKHKILSNSKVFVFPSFTESFGLVYLDAISNGVPVVEYNLPCFEVHRDGVVKVPFKDNKSFAEVLFNIIFDNKTFEKLSSDGISYSKEFNWSSTASSIIKYFDI